MKTNAIEYDAEVVSPSCKDSFFTKFYKRIHRKKYLNIMDDYDWDSYHPIYRKQYLNTRLFYTIDLRKVDFKIIDGKIYLIGCSKPIHYTHRCVWEAIYNLPKIKSISEIGTGCGFFITGLKAMFGSSVVLSASDVNPEQLEFFRTLFPDVFKEIDTYVLDITYKAIEPEKRPDVVFASTVLMHIKGQAYYDGLRNFLLSGSRFAVLMDNWNSHDYFSDLTELIKNNEESIERMKLYTYDSGANVAVVISLKGETLSQAYRPLISNSALKKYFS